MSESQDSNRRSAFMAMGMVVVIWGVNMSVMKLSLTEVSPLAFNTLRFPLGILVMGLLLLRTKALHLPEGKEWRSLIILGLLAHPIYQLLFLTGLWLTSASHTAIFISTTPIWAALGERYFFNERLPRIAWAGILLSLAGVLVLSISRDDGGTTHSLLGDGLVILSAVIWAAYMIWSRPLLKKHSSLWVTAWALFIGGPVLILIGVPDVLRLDWASLTAVTWGGVFYAGLFALAMAYSWTAYGVKVLGATRTAIFANLIPVVAISIARFWLGETLPTLSLVAGGVTLLGVWLTTLSKAPRAVRRPQAREATTT